MLVQGYLTCFLLLLPLEAWSSTSALVHFEIDLYVLCLALGEQPL